MPFYTAIVGTVVIPVCGQHVHGLLDGLAKITHLSHHEVELRHAPVPGCSRCDEERG